MYAMLRCGGNLPLCVRTRYQKRPPTVRDACAVMCPPRMVLPLFTKVGIVFNKTVIFDLLTNKQEEHSLLYKPKVSIFAT